MQLKKEKWIIALVVVVLLLIIWLWWKKDTIKVALTGLSAAKSGDSYVLTLTGTPSSTKSLASWPGRLIRIEAAGLGGAVDARIDSTTVTAAGGSGTIVTKPVSLSASAAAKAATFTPSAGDMARIFLKVF